MCAEALESCHDNCARVLKDGCMDHLLGTDGLLPALRGCHVRRWGGFHEDP